ncbi:hypothetical protein KP509_12G008800 [Ceratopteris richardii]|uniref:non-specific serine/threonine protein kinase n=1 Tax=Ceratopteris richardii TaxID=49495 RepID=A0A8T2TGM2_CERRI|nr:hypothetical protein KP509_12G008800 [Ceratopteris richardii]
MFYMVSYLTCNFLSGPAPKASNQTSLASQGNCFDGASANDKIKCYQSYYNCDIFFQSVPNGSCPNCPAQQSLQDEATCVCTINALKGAASHNRTKVIGFISGGIALIVCVLIIWWGWSAMKKWKSVKDLWEGPEGIQRFLYQDLSRATNGFDSSHEIGHGGFGKVYCGLVNGKTVAIKRAHESSIQSTAGFCNEVILLSRLHHRNLVRLLGFCEEDKTQILVYEYMPNGNLNTLLFKNKGTEQLDWLKRLDIALGVAQGLDYLHSFADPPVIHRDVKPSNVLLDDNMVAKLSDFGISKVAPEFETEFSTRPAGTIGYIDPQYVLREHLTTASDVYSFGMVLMELVSGQRAIDKTRINDINLVEWVKLTSETEGPRSIIDPRLGEDYPERVYYDMIRLALDCASFETHDRPSMKVVVSILENCRWSVAPHILEPAGDIDEGSFNEKQQEECHLTKSTETISSDDDRSFPSGKII